jgi:hypothetical protein
MTGLDGGICMLARLALLVVMVAALGCGDGSSGVADAGYDLYIRCVPGFSATCPEGQPCPTPAAGGGCQGLPTSPIDVPARLGDAAPVPGTAFPTGCQIGLPSLPGVPLWPEQTTCTCGGHWPGITEHDWICPI